MALPSHYTGSDGVVTIDTVEVSLVNYNIDVGVGVINSPRIGKVSDMKYAGKKDITGTITQVLITGDLMAKLMGGTIATSSLEVLLAATDLDAGAREEVAITTDPTDPTSVVVTLTVGDVATEAGSIVIHGTDASGKYLPEVITFAAMTTTQAPQVINGTAAFKTTDYVTVEAGLEKGTAGNYSTLKIDGVAGSKSVQPGSSVLFDIVGKVEDANGKYYQLTANNCFFTGGSFPIGDSETLVQTDLPFVMRDADVDLTLVWTAA